MGVLRTIKAITPTFIPSPSRGRNKSALEVRLFHRSADRNRNQIFKGGHEGFVGAVLKSPLRRHLRDERCMAHSFEKDLAEFFDVLRISVAPAWIGRVELGAFLEIGSHIAAVGYAIEAFDQLLPFLRQCDVDE